ncbi:hypothetical protein BH11BAC3_BH11BAC3_02650 [soil metagenome]
MRNIIDFTKISFPVIAIILLLSSTAFAQTIDDKELKKNVVAIERPLKIIMQLEPKVFEYNTGKYKKLKLQPGRKYGFLTDHLKANFSELVNEKNVSYMTGKNSYSNARMYTIDELSILAVLVASVKEQQQEIEHLRSAIDALQKERASL